MKGKSLAENRKARFDYEILETYEAGISLLGQEVKSIKGGQMSLKEAYVKIINDELVLWNAHVPRYKFSSDDNYDPIRDRKLLLKKKEIRKLSQKLNTAGLTIIPLKVYLNNGKIKVLIGLARGKKQHDKQRRVKERELDRELHREHRKYMIK